MASLLPMILLVGAALLLSLLQLCNSSGRCSESYKCGDDTYSYPFWGGSRPSYCGVPGFQLNCQNSYPTETQIEIRNSVGIRQTYIVLNISEANQIMTIVSSDIWNFNSECPSEFLNDTASYNTSFEKAPGTLNYTLFYGCPFDVSYNSGGSDCYYANNTRNSLYVTADSVGSNQNISECQGSILIPVRPSSVRGISFGIIYDGFDVTYAGSYHSDCVNCTNSGGTCGYKSKYFYCYPPEFIAGNTAKTRNLRRIIALVIGPISGFIFMIILACVCWRRKYSSVNSIVFWKKSKNYEKVEEFLRNNGSTAPKRYHYSDIRRMTNSFKD